MHMKLLSRASMSIRAVSSKVYKLRLYSQLCHPAAMAALLTTLSFLHKMKFPISENVCSSVLKAFFDKCCYKSFQPINSCH